AAAARMIASVRAPVRVVSTRCMWSRTPCLISSAVPGHKRDRLQADPGGIGARGAVGAAGVDAIPEDASDLTVLEAAAGIAAICGDVEVAEPDNWRGRVAVQRLDR